MVTQVNQVPLGTLDPLACLLQGVLDRKETEEFLVYLGSLVQEDCQEEKGLVLLGQKETVAFLVNLVTKDPLAYLALQVPQCLG